MTQNISKESKKERIKYLDIIRGLAAMMIIINHFNAALSSYNITIRGKHFIFYDNSANGNFGVLGVSLFFLISGASLMYTYKDELKLSKYIKKRLVSIYPLFWITYILFFILKIFTHNFDFTAHPKTFPLSIIAMDGYMANWFKTWYIIGEWFLGCIIIMYILFPFFRRGMKKNANLLLVISVIIYFLTVYFNPFYVSIARNILVRQVDIIIGMYFILKIKNVKNWQGISALIFMCILIFVKVPGNAMFGVTILGVTIFITLVWITQIISFEILEKVIFFVSKHSYEIFLTHHEIIYLFSRRIKGYNFSLLKGIVVFCVEVVTILIVSCAIEILFKKLQKIIKTFIV